MKRHLLTYFFNTTLWKNWERDIVNNIQYWVNEDLNRASAMKIAAIDGHKGYSVSDWIYDVLACVHQSKLKPHTKDRLYTEIEALENYHIKNNTYDSYV